MNGFTTTAGEKNIEWQKIYGWEPPGSVPTYMLQLVTETDSFDLGSDRVQRALIAAAEALCKKNGQSLLTCALMVRDESARIVPTLESLHDVCDRLVLLDTGSKDNTVELARDYCSENEWEHEVHECEWSDDFALARNCLLKHCTSKGEFLLLADCNDRLVNARYLRALCALHLCGNQNGISGDPNVVSAPLVLNKSSQIDDDMWRDPQLKTLGPRWTSQEAREMLQWVPCAYFIDVEYQYTSEGGKKILHSEPMMRLIRNDSGWRYSGPVHEVLWNDWWRFSQKIVIPSQRFHIVQDKSLDTDGSQRRWPRDLRVLDAFLEIHPDNPQALYYRAKTLRALQRYGEAAQAFSLRLKLPQHLETQSLQRYTTAYMLAHCIWLNAAVEKQPLTTSARQTMENACWIAFSLRKRAEPLLLLHRLYSVVSQHHRALMVANLATRLPTPPENGEAYDRSAYLDQRYAVYAKTLCTLQAFGEAARCLKHVKSLAGKQPTPMIDETINSLQRHVNENKLLASAVKAQSNMTAFDPLPLPSTVNK